MCISDEKYYTQPAKVGEVHVGNGESAKVTFTSSAKVKLDSGLKTSGNWSINGQVSLSTGNSTSVDYSINGTCCNAQYDLFANYYYRYQAADYRYNGQVTRTEYTVVPQRLVGGAATPVVMKNNYKDGMSVSDVKAGKYGAWFAVSSSANTKHNWTKENSFGLGFSIPTPVGTFNGGTTTSYASSHEVYYSSKSGAQFIHYDYDGTDKLYYVTK